MPAVSAGRRGPDVRSDIWLELELRDSGGIELQLKSKVDFMYGEANRKLIADELNALGIKHCRVTAEDTGALPFVIMARVETAARRALPDRIVGEYLPEPGPTMGKPTAKDCWRRSRLYLPGNEPKFMLNVRIHEPDAVILDLEDSVSPPEKDAALVLVRNALRAVDFGSCERMVRINQLPRGLDEVETIVKAGANVILLPKCENPDQVRAVDERVTAAQSSIGNRKSEIWLMPIVESCEGMFAARDIARASKRVCALTYGLEDYIADLGGTKTPAGTESLWARSQVVNAAKAAGVQAIDTVFADVGDMKALEMSCLAAKEMGFEGKGCIHPRQIPVVHKAFTPTTAEVERAQAIVRAYNDAKARGLGAVSVGSKMIDAPVVKRALRTIELAVSCGCLNRSWDKEPQ
jgi:citrate lyase subunit beta / citryl-CoA lyase